MPKDYKQKCRDVWLKSDEFKEWLRRDNTDEKRVYCSYCKNSLTAKLSDIHAHASTNKHTSAMSGYKQKNKIDFGSVPIKTVEQEAALCLFIAEHTAMAQVDHLGNLCSKYFDSGTAGHIKLHRTKCTSIIKNVLARNFYDDLCVDIGDSKFSLLLDESTDISVTKLLGVVINYFSVPRGVFVSTFLSLVQLEFGNSTCIVEGVENVLMSYKLNIKNLIGIGSDNANVMIGTNRSVYTELKKEVPQLFLIKCVCHSVQLAVSQVCKKHMPENFEFLIYETYNWFCKSASRQMEYSKVYKCINDDKIPLKIPKVSDTRWLSIEVAVSRILDQWEELKLHFELAATKDKCYKSKILSDLYSDKINHLYLTFLKPILSILSTNKKRITEILEHLNIEKIADIERQYRDINLIRWENVNNTTKFWIEVSTYKDSGGNRRFLELSSVAMQMLSLPWSNAKIKRVFSQLSLVKSKLRNSMSVSTTNSILSIRYGLRRLGKCCYDYEVPLNYLRMIGINLSYSETNDSRNELDDLLNIL